MVMTCPVDAFVRGDLALDRQVPPQAAVDWLWLRRLFDDTGCSHIIDTAEARKPRHPASRSIWSVLDAPRAAELSSGCNALR